MRRAFTLVELLIVVSIIAVLIAILLPVIGKAREQGNRVSCLSNLRQIYQTIGFYADDNKDAKTNHQDQSRGLMHKLCRRPYRREDVLDGSDIVGGLRAYCSGQDCSQ